MRTDGSDFNFSFEAPKDGEKESKQAGQVLFQGLTESPCQIYLIKRIFKNFHFSHFIPAENESSSL